MKKPAQTPAATTRDAGTALQLRSVLTSAPPAFETQASGLSRPHMLWTDLRNQIRQTSLPKWKPLIPLFEAVMNSIQAIRELDAPVATGRIVVFIERDQTLFPDEIAPIVGFKVLDNGVGLNDANFDSFNTAYSGLKIAQGGKGLGRFTWLKAFDRVEIESTFADGDGDTPLHRSFVFDENYNPDDGHPVAAPGKPAGTSVNLLGFKEPYRSQASKSSEQIVQRLIEHFLLIFLEPNCPSILIRDRRLSLSANEAFERDFKTAASVHQFKVKDAEFTIHGFRLTTPRVSRHRLVYAANQRGVISDRLEDHVPNLAGRDLPLSISST